MVTRCTSRSRSSACKTRYSGRHRRRRRVQARIPRSHRTTGSRRSSTPTVPVQPFTLFELAVIRIYGLGEERRQADPEGPDRPLQVPRMDDVPDGRGSGRCSVNGPLRQLRCRKDPRRDRALHQRGEAPASAPSSIASRNCTGSPATNTAWPTSSPSRGSAVRSSVTSTSPTTPRSNAGTTKWRRGRRCSAVSRCWPASVAGPITDAERETDFGVTSSRRAEAHRRHVKPGAIPPHRRRASRPGSLSTRQVVSRTSVARSASV